MKILGVTPQLRTTDMHGSIDFYVGVLGFALEFRHEDFYAGVRCGDQVIHLKLADEADPSIAWVAEEGHLHLWIEVEDVDAALREMRTRGVQVVRDVCETEWATRECIVLDNMGHTLYVAERIPVARRPVSS